MEEQHQHRSPENGAARESKGSAAPIATRQDKETQVKEGDPSQQRPVYGADGGPNTSSREDQLPALDNAGNRDSAGAGSDA